MPPADSFIIFGSISQEGQILWVSPSVYDILGYEPVELIGRPGYNIVCPDDQADLRDFRKEYFVNDLVASQIVIRFTAKDGQSFPGMGLVSICYDFTVAIVTVLDSRAEAYLLRRAHSTTMNRRMGYKKEEFERMKRHYKAFTENSWNHQALEPEARVCLIINRFTRNLVVMHASSACERVFHVDPDEITGKPVLLYIRSDDLASFVEQVDLVKSTTAVAQMRFWFQSPHWPHEIPCEAIIIGTTDGITAVVRRCKPFVRKHLLGSGEHFENRSRGSSVSSRWTRSYGSSPASEPCASPSPHAYGSYGSSTHSPLRNVSRETLNQIRIVDLGSERLSVHQTSTGNVQDLMSKDTTASKELGYQEVVAQDYYEAGDDGDNDDIDTVVRGVAISKLEDAYM
ncbi:hypothetical protein B0O80DRAFT_501620 [Mortierella sp. GBAus27b]|nr:hypothetical protein B0O80DRAFT_501620 [Mortierella sp. GBAus27b]